MDTTVTIGGETLTLPPMMFSHLKRLDPFLDNLTKQTGLVDRTEASLGMLAIGLDNISAEDLGTKLRVDEIEGVIAAVGAWMQNSGLIPAGAAPAGEAEAVS